MKNELGTKHSRAVSVTNRRLRRRWVLTEGIKKAMVRFKHWIDTMLLRSTIPILKTTHVTITSVFGRVGTRFLQQYWCVCRFQSHVDSLNKKKSFFWFFFARTLEVQTSTTVIFPTKELSNSMVVSSQVPPKKNKNKIIMLANVVANCVFSRSGSGWPVPFYFGWQNEPNI